MTATSVWTAIGWTFLHVLWLGLIVGLIAAMLRRLLRRARPEVRHGAALACLMGLAVTPFAVFAVVHRPARIVVAVAVESKSSDGITFRGGGQTFLLDRPPIPSIPTHPAAPRASWLEPILTVLPGVWLVGSLLTLGSLVTGLVGVERLRRSSVPLEAGPIAERCRALVESLGIVRKVGVAVCDRIAVPLLIGVARPLILLPSSALSGWSADQIEMALLHELAHLRRCDNLVNLLRRLVESLLFFHPVTWWLSAWVRLERELCCDRLVVDRTGRPRDYARWLAELAGCEPGRGLLASALNERPLTTRIRRILNMEDRSMKPTLPEVLGLCAAVILGVALALPSLAESPGPKPDEAREALARLSASAAAAPSDGDNDQRNATLLKIAKAQLKLGDRVGALATLNRAEPVSLLGADAETDLSTWNRFDFIMNFAVAQHKAGDAAGARVRFRQVAAFLDTPKAAAADESIAQFERMLNADAERRIARYEQANLPAASAGGEGPRVVDFEVAQAGGDQAPPELKRQGWEILMMKLHFLSDMTARMVELGETVEARPLIAQFLKLIESMQSPMKSMLLAEYGVRLARSGDAKGGRELLSQARVWVLDQPESAARDLAMGCLACAMVEVGNIDEAVSLLTPISPGARLEFVEQALGVLSNDDGTVNWLDSGGVKIAIGSPSLRPKDNALARAALPKLVVMARVSGNPKTRARVLATLAHLQARAGDFAGATTTAEAISLVRRADHTGPSDGFYESIKPATFALIATAQAEAGDRNGADSSFARARALTGKIEADDQKLIAQIVLSDKLASSGRVDEAKEVFAEAFPLAAAQSEPRRSRALCMLVENQVKAGDLAGAAGNIEAIRDEPGIQKARALKSLARALRDKGDAEGAATAARRGIDYLAKTKKPIEPGANPGTPGGISRDQFLDFDQESHPVLVQLYLQSMPPDLRILAGESEELAREAKSMHPFDRDRILGELLHETTRREGLERAVAQVEALEAPDARLAAIESLVRGIEKGALAK